MSIIATLILGPALAIVAGQLGAYSSSPPPDLGVKDGRLKGLSPTPNAVSSQAHLYPDHPYLTHARIDPIKYTGDGRAAMSKLRGIVAAMERTRITVDQPDYIRAECTTRLMHFTDDLELWLDEPAGVVQIRSASRVGRGDRGVNRARLEAIRAAFMAP